jgi:O-methyltransferase involved in polyketide biosynthesis
MSVAAWTAAPSGSRPPQAAQWFDVDQPAVIDLRRRLYDEHDSYRMIGSSVTAEQWLVKIPAGLPTLVVAEGLLMYLTESEVRQLLGRLTDRFGSGELLFDTLSRWGPRLSRLFTSGILKWGINDTRDIERWHARLRRLAHTSALAGFDGIPPAPQRMLYRLLYAMPGIRDYDQLNQFAL